MHNVKMEVKGTKLIVELDISPKTLKDAPRSGSGRADLVASTSGWATIKGFDGMALSLNLVKK